MAAELTAEVNIREVDPYNHWISPGKNRWQASILLLWREIQELSMTWGFENLQSFCFPEKFWVFHVYTLCICMYIYIFTFIGMLPPPRMSVQSQSAGWASFVVTYSFNDHGTFSKIYDQRCTLIQMHLYRSISYGMESSYIWLCFPWLFICFHPNWELYVSTNV